ncbi:MAG: DoxX family protein [Gammaproteobacteria bacterium]
MNKLYDVGELAGRVLISAIFILAGASKIGGYAGTQAYMESQGVPGVLLPLVIATELGGGLLVLLGLWTRLAAFALAGFSALAALLFHANFGDPMQQILFMKDFAMAGGFLFLVAHGAGAFSVDGWRAKQASP